jgi:hypothetical protein
MAQKFLTLGSRELYNLDYNHSDSPNGGGANLSALLADANAMFTEIYTLGSLTLALRFPTQVIDLVAEMVYTLTTTLTEEPCSIMVLDSSGNLITDSLQISLSMATGVCVLSIYSSVNIAGTKIKILY